MFVIFLCASALLPPGHPHAHPYVYTLCQKVNLLHLALSVFNPVALRKAKTRPL